MHITVSMLLTQFLTRHPDAVLLGEMGDEEISGIRLLPEETSQCRESFLYLTDRPETVRSNDNHNLMTVCFSPEAVEQIGSLSIYTTENLSACLNCMLEYFQWFADWQRQMEFAVFQAEDLQTFSDLCREVIPAPMLIYDPALKLLAYSGNYADLDDNIFQKAIHNGYLDAESVRYFESSNSFEEVNVYGSASGKPDDYRMHNDLVQAVNVDNHLVVYCILIDTGEMPSAYIHQLFRIFCDYIRRYLENKHISFERDRSASDYFLMDLLEHPETSEETIRDRIRLYDLDFNGSYLVMDLHSDLRVRSNENYYIQLLRTNLVGCRIFSWKENIVLLYQLPVSEQHLYKNHIRKIMDPLLKEITGSRPHLYVSRVFTKISLFALAYQQAEYTAEITPDKTAGTYSFYEDNSLMDLFFQKSKEEILFNYCEPSVYDLARQGTKKSRLALQILYAYLRNDRKMTDAANILHMHRNNVIYHIRQLSEIYGLDFDDPDIRERLLLSFTVLRYVRETFESTD